MMSSRGLFLVFEGLDRSGKSTQSERLVKFLSAQNVPVKKMNFPRRETTIGGLINSYLQSQSELSDEAIHLLFAANRWEVRKEILETLKSGTTVVCDRYAFSGVAYTAAKEVKTIDWCKAPDRGLPSPDKVFFLDVDEDTAKQRSDFGNERYERTEFQRKVGQQFVHFKQDPFWHSLDAARNMDHLSAEIAGIVTGMLADEGLRVRPVESLWEEERPAGGSRE